MGYNKPTYTVRALEADGAIRYFAAFVDGDGALQEVEISDAVYLALEECRRHEVRQVRSAERHHERMELSEEQLSNQMLHPSVSMETIIDAAVSFQMALALLSEKQRRRFLLYHESTD